MKAINKTLTGAAVAALVSVSAAAPAQAQRYDPYYDRDRGISAGEVIAGVAVVAGAVAAVSAIAGQGRYDPYYDRGGYDPRWGGGYDRGFERHAIQACGFEAERRYQRHGQTRFHVRDVQRMRDRTRVLGAVEIWDNRYDRRWGGRGGYAAQRVAVTCEVRANGRVSSFRTHNYNW